MISINDRVVATVPVNQSWLEKGGVRRSVGSLLIAAIAISAVAILVVFSFQSAWHLLGIGRGLVPPEFYHYSALLIILGTTFGQFVGWAAGSALLAYGWYRWRARPLSFRAIQMSMTIVYCGLALGPISFYHLLFGRPLAGIPQPALPAWLRQHYPDTYGLLITGHPWVDLSVIPLAIGVLALLWGSKERVMRHWGLQTLLFFLILATSFVVSLSLAIHSTLVHIRIGF